MEMSHHRHGLQKLTFIGFPANAQFDEHLLKRLAKKSRGVSRLGFSEMTEVNEAARVQLLAAMKDICKANDGSLTEVNLITFTTKPDEGLALMNNVVINDKLIRIEALNLSRNKELFASDKITDAVCLLVSKQTALKHLILGGNDLSSEATEQLMATLKKAKSSATIETLDLRASNWDEGSASEALADFLATAPALKTVHISGQVGSKPIAVTVTEAAIDVKRVDADDAAISIARTNEQ